MDKVCVKVIPAQREVLHRADVASPPERLPPCRRCHPGCAAVAVGWQAYSRAQRCARFCTLIDSLYIRLMTASEKWVRPMALIDKWESHMPWIMSLIAGILYLLTMSPAVGHTDAGELSAVAYTFGVAHPTGYPLFTLLGWLFTRIPIGSVAWRLNLMCLLFVTGAVYVWARFLREFFIQMRTSVKKGDSSYAFRIKLANVLGTIIGTLMLCFGRTWWMQATGTEVYSLQCLLLGLTLWALLKAWWAKEDVFLRWSIFVIALAFCFTNHLTAIILLPGVFYLYFVHFGFKWSSIIQGLKLAGVGLAVLGLMYGMLMLVATTHPAYSWGNVVDWTRLWHHITGRQFSSFMFQGPKKFFVNLLGYFNRLPNELGWDLIWPKIPIWIGLGGMVFQGTSYAFERRREWTIFFALGYFSNLFWASNYDIKDPEPYFIFSFMVVAFLGAMFLRWAWIGYKQFAPYITGIFVVVIGFQMFWNFGATDQRGAYQYEDYSRAALESLPPNALVISTNWDAFVSPAYYLQGCEGLRKDVTIIDYAMLRDRHWYAAHMRVNDPKLATALGSTLVDWEKAVSDFDLRGKINQSILQPRFAAVYLGVLKQALNRPVYIGPEIYDGIARHEIATPPQDLLPVPEAYFIRLQLANVAQNYQPVAAPKVHIRFGGDPQEYENMMLKAQLEQVWAMRVDYETRSGHTSEAAIWQQCIVDLRK